MKLKITVKRGPIDKGQESIEVPLIKGVCNMQDVEVLFELEQKLNTITEARFHLSLESDEIHLTRTED